MKYKARFIKIFDKNAIEETAKIMGESSACGLALKESQKYQNPVFFKLKDDLCVTSKEILDELIKQGKLT